MSDDHGRHDHEAEASIVGAVLNDPSLYDAVRAIVSPADMHRPQNAVVLEAMESIVGGQGAIDIVTVKDELQRRDRLNTAGGIQYLGELSEHWLPPTIAEQHARIVADCAAVRRIEAAARDLVEMCQSRKHSPAALLDAAQSRLLSIGEKRTSGRVTHLSDHLEGVLLRIEQGAAGRSRGVPTGLRDLDARLAGLHGGKLYVIAARPAMGKSALALGIARAVAARGPSLIFSAEMTVAEIADREMAAEAGVDSNRMRLLNLGDAEMSALYGAATRLFHVPLYLDDSSDIAIEDIRSRARQTKAKHGLSLVVVDYLQLMESTGDESNREREVAKNSRGLKKLSKELDVPVIVLSQLNRECEKRQNKRPQLSDLRESGALEQDADAVMFIYRDEVYNPNTADKGVAEIIVAKQRGGPIGTVRAAWNGALTRFGDLAHDSNDRAPEETYL